MVAMRSQSLCDVIACVDKSSSSLMFSKKMNATLSCWICLNDVDVDYYETVFTGYPRNVLNLFQDNRTTCHFIHYLHHMEFTSSPPFKTISQFIVPMRKHFQTQFSHYFYWFGYQSKTERRFSCYLGPSVYLKALDQWYRKVYHHVGRTNSFKKPISIKRCTSRKKDCGNSIL